MLSWMGLGIGASLSLSVAPTFASIAGPFDAADIDPNFPIPADKKFSKEWLASLTSRGEPTFYSSARDELKFIGMPIGGLCCGQVYLGGDGKLWHWDILNLPQAQEWSNTAGPLYATPAQQRSPFTQNFRIAWKSANNNFQSAPLDASGFKNIEFRGDYPIGLVKFQDPSCPLAIQLEAFSPFCPLDVERSSIPATILTYTIKNTSATPLTIALIGSLQNPVCIGTAKPGDARLTSRFVTCASGVALIHGAIPIPASEQKPTRPDITFEDWEKGTYDGWTVTGKAFGNKPRNLSDIASYQGNLNTQGQWTVNTHETRHGEDVGKADTYIGTLTSREFNIDRKYIRFRIGGGKHPGQTCINLLIDGAPVRTSTGADSNRMHFDHWNVSEFAGKKAQIQIVDAFSGSWGQIGIDEIIFTDSDRLGTYELDRAPDFGSIALAMLDKTATCKLVFDASEDSKLGDERVHEIADPAVRPISTLSREVKLAPGEETTISCVIAWHFPNPPRDQLGFIKDIAKLKHHYAARFADAHAIAAHMLSDFKKLDAITRSWREAWYNSTLPRWFLDRTFATISTAATTTCYKFDNGRFYGWEGTYCCAGTCTHVWQYAQGLARVFPEFERSLRENIDFDQEFVQKSGLIHYRGEAARELAIDGQCGTIIRAYREHTMTPDDRYLKKVYPNVKKAMELVIARDKGADGILDGPQYNTLDTTWYGEIAWISSLYLGALRTTAAMALDAGDKDFAKNCQTIADRGKSAMVDRLFNGEYFVHKPDATKPQANSTGTGCHIDQVFGQSMAIQAGLVNESDRVIPREQSILALRSLFKYSFSLDIGPYRTFAEKTVKGGRWYAMPGEGGLLMCTWPKGGSNSATGKSGDAWAAGYFNECMSGFEHQVASHMIAEGLVTEGLAITRMIHERYHASKRNPYNEVECSNHYARAMAAYGSFVAACGFSYHGPRGILKFNPKVFDPAKPKAFRAPFICAQGWGTYSQDLIFKGAGEYRSLSVAFGQLTLSEFTVPDVIGATSSVTLHAKPVQASISRKSTASGGHELTLRFNPSLTLKEGMELVVELK